jgi:hypothetical protein
MDTFKPRMDTNERQSSSRDRGMDIHPDFVAKSRQELLAIGTSLFKGPCQNCLDEQIQMSYLLNALAGTSLVQFPVRVWQTHDTPDFHMELAEHRIGVEVTKIASQDLEHGSALQKKGLNAVFMPPSLLKSKGKPLKQWAGNGWPAVEPRMNATKRECMPPGAKASVRNDQRETQAQGIVRKQPWKRRDDGMRNHGKSDQKHHKKTERPPFRATSRRFIKSSVKPIDVYIGVNIGRSDQIFKPFFA